MTTLKATIHSGYDNLGRHLIKTEDNESVEVAAFGVSPDSITGVAELHALSMARSRRGTRRTLLHTSINPTRELTDAQWQHAWDVYEAQFGLAGREYVQARHVKARADGSKITHCHRVYATIDPVKRTVVNLDNQFARNEAVARTVEYDCYGPTVPMTKGRHNRHAAWILQAQGRSDVVQAMLTQGLCEGSPAFASDHPEPTKSEIEQQRRTEVDVGKLALQVFKLYGQFADRPIDFLAALYGAGYTVKRGDRGWSLIDKAGAVHGLGRLVNRAAKAQGQNLRLRQADVERFFQGIDVERLAHAHTPRRSQQREEAKQVLGVATSLARSGINLQAPSPIAAIQKVVQHVESRPTHPISQKLSQRLSWIPMVPVAVVIVLASWVLKKLWKQRAADSVMPTQQATVIEELASDEAPHGMQAGWSTVAKPHAPDDQRWQGIEQE
jgi:hypothetical protein